LLDSYEDEEEEEEDSEIERDQLYELGKKMGIKNTTWSLEEKVDFDENHPFPTAKFIKNGNQHCCNKKNEVSLFGGKTWGDLWKAYDKVRKDECGHCFIEGVVLKGDTIIFHCGS
jgi:hypothetical protein